MKNASSIILHLKKIILICRAFIILQNGTPAQTIPTPTHNIEKKKCDDDNDDDEEHCFVFCFLFFFFIGFVLLSGKGIGFAVAAPVSYVCVMSCVL